MYIYLLTYIYIYLTSSSVANYLFFAYLTSQSIAKIMQRRMTGLLENN
jgi:hypothetical protein